MNDIDLDSFKKELSQPGRLMLAPSREPECLVALRKIAVALVDAMMIGEMICTETLLMDAGLLKRVNYDPKEHGRLADGAAILVALGEPVIIFSDLLKELVARQAEG